MYTTECLGMTGEIIELARQTPEASESSEMTDQVTGLATQSLGTGLVQELPIEKDRVTGLPAELV